MKLQNDSDSIRSSLTGQRDRKLRRQFLAWAAAGFGLLFGVFPGCGQEQSDVVPPESEPTSSTGEKSEESKKEIASNIEARLSSIVIAQMGVKVDVSRNMRFKEDLKMDSLDCVELVMEVEEEFDIRIADADAEGLQTVGDVLDYIKKRFD